MMCGSCIQNDDEDDLEQVTQKSVASLFSVRPFVRQWYLLLLHTWLPHFFRYVVSSIFTHVIGNQVVYYKSGCRLLLHLFIAYNCQTVNLLLKSRPLFCSMKCFNNIFAFLEMMEFVAISNSPHFFFSRDQNSILHLANHNTKLDLNGSLCLLKLLKLGSSFYLSSKLHTRTHRQKQQQQKPSSLKEQQ